jgi:glycosyltransferase involved in cell wall biosynthesis
MSVYNSEQFLREAVESILTQTIKELEFIIINDGSTDKTAEILSHYDDPRLRVIHQDNRGLSASLNRGLKMAQTELVARMDADDIAYANRLEVQLEEYERLGRPDILGGQVEYISESGHSLGTCRCPLTHQDIIDRLEGEGAGALFHPTVLYKRNSVLRHGGYDSFFRYSTEDYDLWLRMLADCQFANTEHVVLKLRLNSNSMESQALKNKRPSRISGTWSVCVAKQRYLLAKENASHLWDNPEKREQILNLLWPRFVKSGAYQSFMANRVLALVRADLKTPRNIGLALVRTAQLCFSHPIRMVRYLVTRKHPQPSFLKAQDIIG